jgi:hypothetical protein
MMLGVYHPISDCMALGSEFRILPYLVSAFRSPFPGYIKVFYWLVSNQIRFCFFFDLLEWKLSCFWFSLLTTFTS